METDAPQPPTPSHRAEAMRCLASLLVPTDPAVKIVEIELDEKWRTGRDGDLLECGAAILWRPPEGATRSLSSALARMIRRESAAFTLEKRLRRSFGYLRIHRIPPPQIRDSGIRGKLRPAVAAGLLIHAASAPGTTVFDAAVRAAGGRSPVKDFRSNSGGSASARIGDSSGAALLLRVGRSHSPGDPARLAGALELLRTGRAAPVPAPVARGEVAGASWTTESMLTGSPVKKLSPRLWEDLADACALFPRADGPPEAPADDVAEIARTLPAGHTSVARAVPALAAALREEAGIMRHGDLWRGNILGDKGRLTGIVDWDAWHRSGVPGTDLLYAFVTELWVSSRRSLGQIWAELPWRSTSFLAVSNRYFGTLGMRPSIRTLDATGASAWAAQLAGNLRRLPELTGNAQWRERNVTPFLRFLDESEF